MNCELCQQYLPGYLGGSLSGEIKARVDEHLGYCRECSDQYHLLVLSQMVMQEERNTEMNPFLSTRVMAGIQALEPVAEEKVSVPAYGRVLKPALISFSIAAAIFIGVLVGNIYKPVPAAKPVPAEMAYMDDALIESTDLFAND